MRSVANSRLVSGERVAATSTRSVRARLEMARPVDRVHPFVQLAFVAIATAADAPQNPARDPRFQVRPVRERQVPGEPDAAVGTHEVVRAECFEFRRERLLEPARTRREVAFGQNGLATTR